MRSGLIGSRPPHLVPFPFFPLHTLLFLFLFMSSLASCPFISLLSFFCAYNGPGLSVVVPVHLVSLSSQPHTLLSRRLPSHVFILLSLLRAHLPVRLSLNFASPRGGVCV